MRITIFVIATVIRMVRQHGLDMIALEGPAQGK